jgi:hypothetical protein
VTGPHFAFQLNFNIGDHEFDSGQNLFDFHEFSLKGLVLELKR